MPRQSEDLKNNRFEIEPLLNRIGNEGGREVNMAGAQIGAEEWLAQNRRAMIRCPYQPGNLFISQKACVKRHTLVKEKERRLFINDDFFGYKFRKGLSLCRQCHIGKKLAGSARMN